MSRFARRAAGMTSAFVAATALFGAVELITGRPRQQPLEWLEGTWFADYTVPGVLLGVMVGGSSSVAAADAFRDVDRWPATTWAAGAVVTGWVATEVAVLNQPEAPTPIELGYLAVGLSLVVVGLRALKARRHGS